MILAYDNRATQNGVVFDDHMRCVNRDKIENDKIIYESYPLNCKLFFTILHTLLIFEIY